MESENKLLKNVTPSRYFYLSNGRTIKNVHELVNALVGMTDHTFSCHVNDKKNDFANWIRHVYNDDLLAQKIEHTPNKKLTIKHITDALHNHQFSKKTATTPPKNEFREVTKEKPKRQLHQLLS